MRRTIVVTLALLPALSGCGLLSRTRRPKPEPMYVHIENQNFNDATIYTVSRGARARLGAVTGQSSGDFRLPDNLREVAFQIHLLADGNYLTEELPVFPGDELELVITAALRTTRLIRRE